MHLTTQLHNPNVYKPDIEGYLSQVPTEYLDIIANAIEQRFPWECGYYTNPNRITVQDWLNFHPWDKLARDGRNAWVAPDGTITHVKYGAHTFVMECLLGYPYIEGEKIYAHVSEYSLSAEDALRYVVDPTREQRIAVRKMFRAD